MLSRFVVSQVKHNSYFLVGLALGLWLALAGVPLGEESCAPAGAPAGSASGAPRALDEYEPVREERPLGAAGAPAPARSLQRPRYYSTELGIRAPLLAAALSSEDALETRAAALNQTAARLQPALRFFMTARGPHPHPPRVSRPNVVGFTDTREMLKPFHALKYLADNHLDEYDFFFLVSDTSFVNARRLTELVAELSVSQDVYMGSVADDDSHYCSLEGGILLSNSVLRAVHGALDWCVRNSYSPRHHENIGRCVLHAAHVACQPALQGSQYRSVVLGGAGGAGAAGALRRGLAAAVTAHPVTAPEHFYELHAYVSRVYLELDAAQTLRLRRSMVQLSQRHPPGYSNTTWPPGLRADPGLAPPLPDTRFDHLRWTRFNESHAFMPDDHRAVAPLSTAHKKAVQLVLGRAGAWARRVWGARDVTLAGGAWRWEPARALRYRLLLRLTLDGDKRAVRQVEVARPLGAARLVRLPYVTESARVWLLLRILTTSDAEAAGGLLQRIEANCLKNNNNVNLIVVVGHEGEEARNGTSAAVWPSLRDAVTSLVERYRAHVQAVQLPAGDLPGEGELLGEGEGEAGLGAGLRAAPRDALVLLLAADVEFNDDFLNRVRMNTIAGWQWYLPVGFARYSLYSHPLFVDESGKRPQVNTGRFNHHHHDVLAFYRSDYDSAVSTWAGAAPARSVRAAALLAAAPLHCVSAPEPALVRPPRAAPCPAGAPARCLRLRHDEGGDKFARLDLGAKHSLARLLLETQAEAA